MKQLHLGSNIRRIRMLLGYTEEYLASELGMTTGGYSKLERRESVSVKHIDHIAQIFEVSRRCIIEFDEIECLQAYVAALENVPAKADTNNDPGRIDIN